ncbi:MAG: septal ring lytic transglycosylase RlpA family protein [Bryobacterales bacterium]|nr:septal ring lytic transglycosylase RlpA family protein [Bryobacterales bacterium]
MFHPWIASGSLIPALAAVLLLSGCGAKKPRAAAPQPRPVGWTETGIASWYGHPYHGRRAANGEVYDMQKMTAAHQTLPFETWVRVRNLDNRRETEVRINDRGPFVKGRIIDLSRAAAEEIAMIGPGTAKVRIQVIAPPRAAAQGGYAVQVGAFASRAAAEELRTRLQPRFGKTFVAERPGQTVLYRVLVGQERSATDAEALAQRLRRDGLRDAFVVAAP